MVNHKMDEVDRVVSVISLATSLNTTISNGTSCMSAILGLPGHFVDYASSTKIYLNNI